MKINNVKHEFPKTFEGVYEINFYSQDNPILGNFIDYTKGFGENVGIESKILLITEINKAKTKMFHYYTVGVEVSELKQFQNSTKNFILFEDDKVIFSGDDRPNDTIKIQNYRNEYILVVFLLNS